jgi:hypothetical protein
MDISYVLYDSLIFNEVFKYGDGAKFRDYGETYAEPLCVEFYNFMQCRILIKYLSFSLSVYVVPVINW